MRKAGWAFCVSVLPVAVRKQVKGATLQALFVGTLVPQIGRLPHLRDGPHNQPKHM